MPQPTVRQFTARRLGEHGGDDGDEADARRERPAAADRARPAPGSREGRARLPVQPQRAGAIDWTCAADPACRRSGRRVARHATIPWTSGTGGGGGVADRDGLCEQHARLLEACTGARRAAPRSASPASTGSPGLASSLRPAPGSMVESRRSRPAPSSIEARPIRSACIVATNPARGAVNVARCGRRAAGVCGRR